MENLEQNRERTEIPPLDPEGSVRTGLSTIRLSVWPSSVWSQREVLESPSSEVGVVLHVRPN